MINDVEYQVLKSRRDELREELISTSNPTSARKITDMILNYDVVLNEHESENPYMKDYTEQLRLSWDQQIFCDRLVERCIDRIVTRKEINVRVDLSRITRSTFKGVVFGGDLKHCLFIKKNRSGVSVQDILDDHYKGSKREIKVINQTVKELNKPMQAGHITGRDSMDYESRFSQIGHGKHIKQ